MKISSNNKYNGWVSDFNLKVNKTGAIVKLDLHTERDLFLLFVIASAWSRSAKWENAVFFTTYLKQENDWEIKTWLDNNFIKAEIEKREEATKNILSKVSGIKPREEVSFRSDLFHSVQVLSQNWNSIKQKLNCAKGNNDWNSFIAYIGSIVGLGIKGKRMRIKIPLILRELKCQRIYNISGEYCCVVDKRVRDTYKKYIEKKLPHDFLSASKEIWNDFGELYDIPAFAYEDFRKLGLL